jgi:hypothetical protein
MQGTSGLEINASGKPGRSTSLYLKAVTFLSSLRYDNRLRSGCIESQRFSSPLRNLILLAPFRLRTAVALWLFWTPGFGSRVVFPTVSLGCQIRQGPQ